MKQLCLLFFFISSLICSHAIHARAVPLDGRWDERGLRSLTPIPFSVEKDGNTLYIHSIKQVEGVTVRIISPEGIVFYEEVCTFLPSEPVPVFLDGQPGGEYTLELSHQYGYLVGPFTVD